MTLAKASDGTLTPYHVGNYPIRLGDDGGNWAYWCDAAGNVAAIPRVRGNGCRSSHFGDLTYWRRHTAERCVNLTVVGRRIARGGAL